MSALPEPFSLAGCDVRHLNWMPFFGRDFFLSDTYAQCQWEPRAFFALQHLMWSAWREVPAGSLPNDDRKLRKLAGIGHGRREWLDVRDIALSEFTLCSDGRLYHAGLCSVATPLWRARQNLLRRVDKRLSIQTGAWAALRDIVFERDDYTCVYCGAQDVPMECDHVVPIARGGLSGLDNLTTSCVPCNRSKGARTPAEWRGRA